MSNFEKFSVGLSFVLLIWFYTTPLIDYAKLFGVGKFFKEKEWIEYLKTYKSLMSPKYPVFLRETYPSWETKLIGCPICLAGFLHALVAILGLMAFQWGLIEGLIQGLYGGFITILGYFFISFLIKE